MNDQLLLLVRVLQHHLGAVHVGLDRVHRLLDDQLHADGGGQVEHDVALVDQLGQQRFVGDRVDRVARTRRGPSGARCCRSIRSRGCRGPALRGRWLSSRSARCEPMNPAPPVMSAFTRYDCPFLELACTASATRAHVGRGEPRVQRQRQQLRRRVVGGHAPVTRPDGAANAGCGRERHGIVDQRFDARARPERPAARRARPIVPETGGRRGRGRVRAPARAAGRLPPIRAPRGAPRVGERRPAAAAARAGPRPAARRAGCSRPARRGRSGAACPPLRSRRTRAASAASLVTTAPPSPSAPRFLVG